MQTRSLTESAQPELVPGAQAAVTHAPDEHTCPNAHEVMAAKPRPSALQRRVPVVPTHSEVPGVQARIAQRPDVHDCPEGQVMVLVIDPRASQVLTVMASTQVALEGTHTRAWQTPAAVQNELAPQSASVTQSTQRPETVSHTMLNALHCTDERHAVVATQVCATQRSPAPQSTSPAQVTQLCVAGSHTPPGHIREDSHTVRATQDPPRHTGRAVGHSTSAAHSTHARSSDEHACPVGHSAELRHPAATSDVASVASIETTGTSGAASGAPRSVGASTDTATSSSSASAGVPVETPLGEHARRETNENARRRRMPRSSLPPRRGVNDSFTRCASGRWRRLTFVAATARASSQRASSQRASRSFVRRG